MGRPVRILGQVLLCLAGVGLLYAAGWFSHDYFGPHSNTVKPRRVYANGFAFTSPLLDLEFPEGMSVNYEPLPFRHKVDEYIKQQIGSGAIKEAAVYYRDLLDGPWFGINEDIAFNPASMTKLAVMIAWLKLAEKEPQVLKMVLTNNLKEDMRARQTFKPARSAEPGHSYTVEELIRLMVSYSDNNAQQMLRDKLDPEAFDHVLHEMDVDYKTHVGGIISLTVHGYSGLFRILYNASYLNREMSEKALKLLSAEDFPQGIVAGIPRGVTVASKFGEIEAAPGAYRQLHEFGIVYHPRHRYIIGIMTRGNDFNRMAQVIQGVSRIVYTEVDAGTFSPDNVSR